jgi:hypothetical protein
LEKPFHNLRWDWFAGVGNPIPQELAAKKCKDPVRLRQKTKSLRRYAQAAGL